MSDFLTQAACCGIWPRRIEVAGFRSRPELVSQLMKDRHVPRFIIAPDGLGKSVLACEYAETVFSFKHVFWIDCHSPCFFRDMDEKNLAERIIEKDENVRLVVFDGLRLLDEARVESFDEAVEKLLEHASEVIVTLPPSSDVYGRLFHDRFCIDARDMMLSDAELEISRLMAQRSGESQICFALPGPDENEATRRIAGMTWGNDTGEAFLGALVQEDLLSEVLAWMFVALIVRVAHGSDVSFLPRLEEDDLVSIAENYPFFGLNVLENEFLTIEIDVAFVVKAFSPNFDRFANVLHFENVEEMHSAIAAHLFSQDRDVDACHYIRAAGTRAVRERWLAAHGRELFLRGELSAACDLFAALRPERCSSGLEVCMVHAWCLVLFNEHEEARHLSRRVVPSPYSDESTSIFAALLLSCYGTEGERAKADASLLKLLGLENKYLVDACDYGRINQEKLASEKLILYEELEEYCKRADASIENTGKLLACMRIAQRLLPERAGELWCTWCDRDESENVLLLGAAWIMRDCPDRVDSKMRQYVQQHLEKRFAIGGLDVIALRVANMFEVFTGKGRLNSVFKPNTIEALMRNRAMLEYQQREFLRARVNEARCEKDEKRGVLRSNLGIAPARFETARSTVSPLRVRLFGGLEVSIGDRVIDESEFRRAKCRTLLAILVLAEGREVSATTLMEQLWPASNATCARRCLYTVWGQLKKTLGLPDGSCPYLSKHQSGYRIENRYLISDVARANELCRHMLVQRDHVQKSQDLIIEFNNLYSAKLLPSEVDNEMIVRMRDEYQKRFVDALVSMAGALGREGRVDDALSFATCAFEADRTREDVYLALMRAQYEAGQRVQAMKTYMECRSFLSEELGIDPSSDVERLYLSFLEDDCALA